MGLNINTPDYSNYEAMYNYCDTARYAYVEIGFRLFCIASKRLGLSFQQFRMVYATCYLILTINTITWFTTRKNFVLVLFFMWPFIGFVSGMRFAMAAAIACSCIRWLCEDSKSGTVKYIIGIIIAAMFHYSAFFYLVFVIKKNKNTTKKNILLILFIVLVSAFIYSPLPYMLVTLILKNERLLKWIILSDVAGVVHSNLLGFISNSLLVVSAAVLCNWAVLIIQHNNFQILNHLNDYDQKSMTVLGQTQERHYRNFDLISRISMLNLLLIPGYIITSEYSRVFYGILLLNYCLFAEAIKTRKGKININSLIFSIFVIAWTCMLLWYYTYSYKSHDVFATLRDNILFY